MGERRLNRVPRTGKKSEKRVEGRAVLYFWHLAIALHLFLCFSPINVIIVFTFKVSHGCMHVLVLEKVSTLASGSKLQENPLRLNPN